MNRATKYYNWTTKSIITILILALFVSVQPSLTQAADDPDLEQPWGYHAIFTYGLVSKTLKAMQQRGQIQDIIMLTTLIKLGEDGYYDMVTKEAKERYLADKIYYVQNREVYNAILRAERGTIPPWKSIVIAIDAQGKYFPSRDTVPAGKELGLLLKQKLALGKEICNYFNGSARSYRNKTDWHNAPRYLAWFYSEWLPSNFARYRNRAQWGMDDSYGGNPGAKQFLTDEQKSLFDERFYVAKFIDFCDRVRPVEDITWETVQWFIPATLAEKAIGNLLLTKIGQIASKVSAPVVRRGAIVATRLAETKVGSAGVSLSLRFADSAKSFAFQTVRSLTFSTDVVLDFAKIFAKSNLPRRLAQPAIRIITETADDVINFVNLYFRNGYPFRVTAAEWEKIVKGIRFVPECSLPGAVGTCKISGAGRFAGEIEILDEVVLTSDNFLRQVATHEMLEAISRAPAAGTLARVRAGIDYDPIQQGGLQFFALQFSNHRTRVPVDLARNTIYPDETNLFSHMLSALQRKYVKERVPPRLAQRRAWEDGMNMILHSGANKRHLDPLFGKPVFDDLGRILANPRVSYEQAVRNANMYFHRMYR